MKVASVIVTYGKRKNYLEKVINRLVEEGVDKVLLISNNSDPSTETYLKALQKENNNKFIIKLFAENTGSAQGFNEGIKLALESEVDFLWLLDDDNQPKKGALQILKDRWITLAPNRKIDALLSYRADRPLFKQALEFQQPEAMLGEPNSFLGFSLFGSKNVGKAFPKQNQPADGRIIVAPYGGMFFHRELVETIGLPDQEYFLYGDDYDYSIRISNAGGAIYLQLDSELVDLEKSFHLETEKKAPNRYFKTDSLMRIYYSVRNGIWFEKKHRVKNRFYYFLNGLTYVLLIVVQFMTSPKHWFKLPTFLKGIVHGISDRKVR